MKNFKRSNLYKLFFFVFLSIILLRFFFHKVSKIWTISWMNYDDSFYNSLPHTLISLLWRPKYRRDQNRLVYNSKIDGCVDSQCFNNNILFKWKCCDYSHPMFLKLTKIEWESFVLRDLHGRRSTFVITTKKILQ